jgi:hypothetical protein
MHNQDLCVVARSDLRPPLILSILLCIVLGSSTLLAQRQTAASGACTHSDYTDDEQNEGAIVRLILASLAFAAVAIPAWGQNIMSREQTFRRSVQAGQELRVFTYARWHTDCRPSDPPRVVLRTSPTHGTVSLRPGPSTVSFIREGMPDCTGRTYQGLGVWYVPAPGFRGGRPIRLRCHRFYKRLARHRDC